MRIRALPLSLALGLLIVSQSNGQKHAFVPNFPDSAVRASNTTKDATDMTDAKNKALPSPSEIKPARTTFRFDLIRINAQVVAEFEKAWSLVKGGTIETESLVLLFRKPDGTYVASQARYTNEYRKLTFTWQPNAIAIVHTHPNAAPCKPTDEDKAIADKYKVPIFTITNRGMFMYDPATKVTAMVHKDLDWLETAKWTRDQIVALADK